MPLSGAETKLKTADAMTIPARSAVAITPHDTNTINPTRGIYVGGGGDVVAVLDLDGTTSVTFKNVPDGAVLPFSVKIVKTTSTATYMIALY